MCIKFYVTIASLFFVSACSHRQPVEKREPASSLDNLDNHVAFVREFVSPNSEGKHIRYKMSFSFNTSMDKAYLKETAQQAFEYAVAKTLGVSEKMLQEQNGRDSLLNRFKGNLTEALLQEFVKTLYVYKILNGTIQVNLQFSPEPDSPYSMQNELANNHLVHFGDTNSTWQKLDVLLNQSATNQSANLVHNPLVKENVQKEGKAFIGGNITLWLKLVDLNWEPFKQPIPRTRENAVKGFIRFRKFYIAEHNAFPKLICPQVKPLVTEDTYLNFNIANMKPTLASRTTTKGRLLPLHEGIEGLLKDVNSPPDLGFPSSSKAACDVKENF